MFTNWVVRWNFSVEIRNVFHLSPNELSSLLSVSSEVACSEGEREEMAELKDVERSERRVGTEVEDGEDEAGEVVG